MATIRCLKYIICTKSWNQIHFPRKFSKKGGNGLKELIEKLVGRPKKMPEEPVLPCCMQGCANCPWIKYIEDLKVYFNDDEEKLMEVINNIQDSSMKAFLMSEMRFGKDPPK